MTRRDLLASTALGAARVPFDDRPEWMRAVPTGRGRTVGLTGARRATPNAHHLRWPAMAEAHDRLLSEVDF